MKYTDRLIPELKELEAKKYALRNIPERIKTLELQYESIKATDYDAIIVSGGGENKKEEALVSNIAERDLLQQEYQITFREVQALDEALTCLTRDEYRVLELFFIRPQRNKVDALRDELHVEVATVYRIKERALINLARRLYGQVSL